MIANKRKLDFEDRILRSSYFKHIKSNEIDLTPYQALAYSTASRCYSKHQCSFKKIPLNKDDIRSIALVYTYIYLSLYREDGLSKKQERNKIISFIRQKFGTISHFCNDKGKNILAREDKIVFVQETMYSKSVSRIDIAENPEEYGFKFVTRKEYNAAKNKTKTLGNRRQVIGEDGYKMHKLTIVDTTFGLSGNEYRETLTSNTHYFMSPEEILIEQEENEETVAISRNFNDLTDEAKNKTIESFVRKNGKNKDNKSLVLLAKRYLKSGTFDYIDV